MPSTTHTSAPLEAPGFRWSIQSRKGVLSLSALVSHLSLLPLAAWDSSSLCIVLPFNCLYRPFQACPTLIFPGSECNATNLSDFPHHTPLCALFFSNFFSLFIDLEKSCNVNTQNADSHLRQSELCALCIFCRGGGKSN